MLRARAPVGQGLGGPWLLDGHEAFPLQALEHRERRRQQFTLLAVVPTPTCDRRLDGGDQELGRRPSVTRFHRRAADRGEPFIRKSPEPSAPTRSPTTDSIRAKLIPGDSDDFRRSYSRWLSHRCDRSSAGATTVGRVGRRRLKKSRREWRSGITTCTESLPTLRRWMGARQIRRRIWRAA